MRSYVLVYINGKRHEISGDQASMTLARFLRYEKSMSGTKIVCSEGDCGACTVLIKRHIDTNQNGFHTINSCIAPMYLLDCCHIISVEGIKEKDRLHPVQESMAKNHGAQCGYCTPGFICSMTSLVDDMKNKGSKVTEQKTKNYLTGNLCRCTGYKSIITAAMDIDLTQVTTMDQRYNSDEIDHDFDQHLKVSVKINYSEGEIILPSTEKELLELKHSGNKLNSGGTDLGVFINKGKVQARDFVSPNNIKDYYEIKELDDCYEIGAKVTLDIIEKKLLGPFKEFSEFLHIFASPQIKNKASLIGNIANGSPIGDSLPFLMVAEATLILSNSTSSRRLPITRFYKGYKDFDLKEDEIITKVLIPKTNKNFKLYKVSVRRDLDIAAVSLAVKYELSKDNKINDIAISFGGVGPTVLRISELEKDLIGKEFNEAELASAAKKIKTLINPLSDLRASKEYRLELCHNLLMKFYHEARV